MAEEAKSKTPADAPAQPAAAKSWRKSVLTSRWLAALIVGSLVVHGVVFVVLRKSAARATPQPEFTVGTFSIAVGNVTDARGTPGKFNLHVRFVDDLDIPARARMTSHEFRVRESIEGLLRNSQGIQLDEQALTRLKHQIQDRVDEAIDLRAVAEVIITDLSVPLPTSIPTSISPEVPAAAPNMAPTAVPTAGGRAAAHNLTESVSKSTVSVESSPGY